MFKQEEIVSNQEVSAKNTKNEILEAYQTLLGKVRETRPVSPVEVQNFHRLKSALKNFPMSLIRLLGIQKKILKKLLSVRIVIKWNYQHEKLMVSVN